jgi:hypothetical protein
MNPNHVKLFALVWKLCRPSQNCHFLVENLISRNYCWKLSTIPIVITKLIFLRQKFKHLDNNGILSTWKSSRILTKQSKSVQRGGRIFQSRPLRSVWSKKFDILCLANYKRNDIFDLKKGKVSPSQYQTSQILYTHYNMYQFLSMSLAPFVSDTFDIHRYYCEQTIWFKENYVDLHSAISIAHWTQTVLGKFIFNNSRKSFVPKIGWRKKCGFWVV